MIPPLDGLAREALDRDGCCVLRGVLDEAECSALIAAWDDEAAFRSRVVMRRHGFGEGEYRYFDYPLPARVQALRALLYPPLAVVANDWCARLGMEARYPDALEAFLEECHGAGQPRPTPLLLRYEAGGYNCLHQDLYGPTVFPLQATVLLNEPGRDFEGGEFLLTEQRPRRQSRARVVPLARGDAVIFAVNERPLEGARGDYRVKLRHGVSDIRRGIRHALGVIFHDAA